jgi:hypothetical protein
MWTGVQFTGSLGPGASQRWFTYAWPVTWHVIWYMMPTSPQPGAPELEWSVAVERANATQCTYWITIKNLTSNNVNFEARYGVLS